MERVDVDKYVGLLQRMVAIPSVSRDESRVADCIMDFLQSEGLAVERLHNNLIVKGKMDTSKPTLLLNSHIDTVKPSAAYTRDPFAADIEDGKLYGLGSNDAGASVVSLIAAYTAMRDADLPVNLILAISAEEEVMGEHGMRALLPHLQASGINVDMALVGEPTEMQAAVGERGLVVLDCVAHGRQGHAARNEGDNAIYRALRDVEALQRFRFPCESSLLGPVKVTVTQIDGGWQHNVVPDTCKFVVDVRTTDAYTNEEVVAMLGAAMESEATPRSTRIRASAIDCGHPLVRAAVATGAVTYVSPTTSDMALMPFPSLKLGPGRSARSHQADEYVLVSEIRDGISGYISLLNNLTL